MYHKPSYASAGNETTRDMARIHVLVIVLLVVASITRTIGKPTTAVAIKADDQQDFLEAEDDVEPAARKSLPTSTSSSLFYDQVGQDGRAHGFTSPGRTSAIDLDASATTTGSVYFNTKQVLHFTSHPNSYSYHSYQQQSTTVKNAVAILSNDLHDTESPELTGKAVESDGNEELPVEDYIYWSADFERRLPKGFSPNDDKKWVERIKSSVASELLEGCGRMQNRLIVMADGQLSCARHRTNDDQIQGDIFSFVLSRLLGITNLPPAVLVATDENSLWQNVRSQMHSAQWQPHKAVVLTQFVHNLSQAYIPKTLRGSSKRFHPQDLKGLNDSELVEAAQWSDLIIFDYLTANLDRVVNNMFNQQWNSQMMASPAHNLVKTKGSNLLLFVDNESGLFHGYRLLSKYEPYHRSLLDAVCVFRRSTADMVLQLHRQKNVGHLLRVALNGVSLTKEPILPPLPEKNIKILQQRLHAVARQINDCRSRYHVK